jgi:hypothetical protein
MRATPKEIANANDTAAMREWILTEKEPRNLQEIFRFVSIHTHSAEFALAQNAVRILIAESADASAQRMEESTKRLLWATYILVILTVFLTVFTYYLVRSESKPHKGLETSTLKPDVVAFDSLQG